MEYEEFIRRVQQVLNLSTRQEAGRIGEVCLEVLGERLPRVHRQHLAAQLPAELKKPLFKTKRATDFPLEKFYDRVAARANIGFHEAVKDARGVMRVLRDAVAAGELDDFLSEIPHEYDELFGRSHPGLELPVIDTHQVKV